MMGSTRGRTGKTDYFGNRRSYWAGYLLRLSSTEFRSLSQFLRRGAYYIGATLNQNGGDVMV